MDGSSWFIWPSWLEQGTISFDLFLLLLLLAYEKLFRNEFGSGNFLKVMLWNSQCKGSKWAGSWKWSGSKICSKSFSGGIQLHLPFHLRAHYRITWQDRIHLHIQHWCPPRSWSLVLPLGRHNFTQRSSTRLIRFTSSLSIYLISGYKSPGMKLTLNNHLYVHERLFVVNVWASHLFYMHQRLTTIHTGLWKVN